MKIFLIFMIYVLLAGCSTFNETFPDRSREYERAETLPDLEIPPDLVSSAINDSMSIPGEDQRITPTSRPTANSTPTVGQATIGTINNDKSVLSMPEDYTIAWDEVEKILQEAEIQVNEQDSTTGIFKISYSPDGQSGGRGLFEMIKTWNFRASGDVQEYQLSLTGVGNKTEVVILDMSGESIDDDISDGLLTTIRDHYNLSRNQ